MAATMAATMTAVDGKSGGPRARQWAVGVAAVVAVAVAVGGFLAWRHAARPVDPRLAAVVARLAADPLSMPVDGRGRVDLSTTGFAGLTPRDEAFVVRRPDGSFVALFPTYYGGGTTLVGLLYTSRPFAPGDTFDTQPTQGDTQTVIHVANYRGTRIDNRIDDHWYRVSYGMK